MAAAAGGPCPRALACPGAQGMGRGAVGQLLSLAPSPGTLPAPPPTHPTSKRAMFLPSYSFPFSRSVLLMKGLLSLGLPSPAEIPPGQPGSPHPHRESIIPAGLLLRGVTAAPQLPQEGCWGRGCHVHTRSQDRRWQRPSCQQHLPCHARAGAAHPQEPRAALPGAQIRRSASTQ